MIMTTRTTSKKRSGRVLMTLGNRMMRRRDYWQKSRTSQALITSWCLICFLLVESRQICRPWGLCWMFFGPLKVDRGATHIDWNFVNYGSLCLSFFFFVLEHEKRVLVITVDIILVYLIYNFFWCILISC